MMFDARKVDPEAIYLRLPTSLQHLACSYVGWRTERTRYAGDFGRLLEEAEARTYWPVEEIRALRDSRLADFVVRSAATVPFYRERFREAGVAPLDIRAMDDLASLPILTKEEVQAHASEFCSTLVPTGDKRGVHTSGTTGGALRFTATISTLREQWAIWWRYRRWHGIRKETWCAVFGGRSVVPSWEQRAPFWRVNYPGRQLLFSGYHMSPGNLPMYVTELRKRKPPWLHGYPSLLALIASHLLDGASDVGYDVKWVTTGAENLLPHQADVIERAFGVRPLQHYGLAEGVANVSQCELGALHVDEDFAPVEFVPLGRDGLHRVIGTNVANPATALIRYDTQDLATIHGGASCSCGRPGRVVERIDGRLEDYVVLRNGARLGRMDHIFKDMVNIREAQIHQARPGEITIRVVRGGGYSEEDEQALLEEAVKRVGTEMDIAIDYVRSLQRSSVGKLRLVVSEISDASIEKIPSTRV